MKDIINASTEQDTIYLSRISRKLAILVVGFTLIDMLRDEIGTVCWSFQFQCSRSNKAAAKPIGDGSFFKESWNNCIWLYEWFIRIDRVLGTELSSAGAPETG